MHTCTLPLPLPLLRMPPLSSLFLLALVCRDLESARIFLIFYSPLPSLWYIVLILFFNSLEEDTIRSYRHMTRLISPKRFSRSFSLWCRRITYYSRLHHQRLEAERTRMLFLLAMRMETNWWTLSFWENRATCVRHHQIRNLARTTQTNSHRGKTQDWCCGSRNCTKRLEPNTFSEESCTPWPQKVGPRYFRGIRMQACYLLRQRWTRLRW